MFITEGLTDNGWSFEARHDSRDNAFWHARAKSDATGRTFRLISQDQQMVCLLTSKGSDCWGMESDLVA